MPAKEPGFQLRWLHLPQDTGTQEGQWAGTKPSARDNHHQLAPKCLCRKSINRKTSTPDTITEPLCLQLLSLWSQAESKTSLPLPCWCWAWALPGLRGETRVSMTAPGWGFGIGLGGANSRSQLDMSLLLLFIFKLHLKPLSSFWTKQALQSQFLLWRVCDANG